MIFVTVGTHEQPFDRLVKYIDELKQKSIIKEKVIMQIGYGIYEPQYCSWNRMNSYQEMEKYIREARIVITHGGPSSFIMPLQMGKIPIVVPRRKQFGEHVNDHQVKFVGAIQKRQKNIIPVFEIEKLEDIISNYDKLIADMQIDLTYNNMEFNRKLEDMVKQMF